MTDKPLRKRNHTNGFKVNQTRPYLNRLDLNLPIQTFYSEQLITSLPSEIFSVFSTSFCENRSQLKPSFSDLVKYAFFSAKSVIFYL